MPNDRPRRVRSIAILCVAVALLASCRQYYDTRELYEEHAGGCDAFARIAWVESAEDRFSAEAASRGASCNGASLYMALRDREGRALWSESVPAGRVYGFARVRGRREMEDALAEWLVQPEGFQDSRALPVWRRGNRAPQATNGYPFVVEPGVRGAVYRRLRAEARPLFCYAIALDAARCVVLTQDEQGAPRIWSVGRQFFPPAE